jgi:O-antigen ligase
VLNIRAAQLLDFSAKVFAVLVLFLSTNALVRLLLYPGGEGTVSDTDPAVGDPVTQVMWLGIYGITLLLIAVRWEQFVQVVTRDKLLVLLVGIAVFSVLWSAAPEVTLRRIVALVGTTMIGAYLATRYSPSELLRLLAWALGMAALLSLVFALALPSYGIDPYDEVEAWRGIYSGGKNELGRTMALSAVVFLLLALGGPKRRWVAWAGFGLSVGLLLLSNSQTSLFALLIVVVLLLPYAALRWRYTLAIPCFILALVALEITALWLDENAQSVLRTLGRDTTLTGRTELWPAVFEMIGQRPLVGYGYGAFWLGWEGESAQVFHLSGIPAHHAHNGFLDLWLHLGLLGLLTFAVGYLLVAHRAVTWVRLTKTPEELWPLAFLTFVLAYNFSESLILENNNVFWILYVAVALSTLIQPTGAGKGKWTAPKDWSAP